MDDLINIFVKSNFTEEAQEDIFQALGLFRTFNYLDKFVLIDEMLMMSSFQETTEMTDVFTGFILTGQAYLLDRHGIVLTDETTLAFNNTVLRVLFQLQRLEDPGPVLRILENSESNDIKYGLIMEMYSSVSIQSFLQIIEVIRPVFLKNLATFLYEAEDSEEKAVEEIPLIREQVRAYKEVFGINPVVRTVLDIGTVMGEPFELMLPMYDEFRSIVTDEKVLVETLLFLLLFSSDGVHNPMEVFEKHADHLVSDMTVADRLGRTIGEMCNQLSRHKEKRLVTN